MSLLPADRFENPIWHALQSTQRHLGVHGGDACRYLAEVAPFGAVASLNPSTIEQLRLLLAPGESIWLVADPYPASPGLRLDDRLECLQMVLPAAVALEPAAPGIAPLTVENAGEMLALTDLAYPGFFRRRTCEMGSYSGVRGPDRTLIAMAGERITLEGYPEISGICTHPAFRGRGLAAGLIAHVVREHRERGFVSWLHVAATNHGAIALYRRLGFEVERSVMLNRVSRQD